MTIEISKKEYRNLLDLLYMGEWLLDANDVSPDPKKKKYREIVHKFYSYAKEMGFENLIVYDKQLKQYFPTREYEEMSMCLQYIGEYEDESFWDELVNRMTERDLQIMIKEGVVKKPSSFEEVLRIGHPIETKYEDEFEKNGIDNLIIQTDHNQ
jgi:hypothetical protein